MRWTALRARQVAWLALAGTVAVSTACGGDEDNGGGADAGDMDAASDGGGGDGSGSDVGTDTGTPGPNAESVFFLFTREAAVASPSLPDYVQLMVATDECTSESPELCSAGDATCELTEVMPPNESEPLCNNGCVPTDDLAWLVFGDPGESRTLRKIAMSVDGDSVSVSGVSEIIATDVSEWDVGGHLLAYVVDGAVTTHDLDSGSENAAGTVSSGDRLHVTPDGAWVYMTRVTSLTAMDLVRVPASGGEPEIVHSFVDGGPPNAAGSLLRGSEPVAFSPDGTRVAVLTNYRNQSNWCVDPSECLEPGFTCPTGDARGRCYAQQLSVQIINLEAYTSLGEACTSDAECGTDHFCDLSAPDNEAMGACLPGRFVLGASGQDRCALLTLGQYDGHASGLAWRSAREVMGLLTNTCNGTPGTVVTDLVSLDIDQGVATPLIENPGLPFDTQACIDPDSNCYEAGACVVEFQSFAASPSGETVSLVGDSFRSQNTTELWSFDTSGAEDKNVMTTSSDYGIISVTVHPRN